MKLKTGILRLARQRSTKNKINEENGEHLCMYGMPLSTAVYTLYT
jgi:hypothetical protein